MNDHLLRISYIALGITTMAAFFGWKAHHDLKKAVNEQVKQHIDEYWRTEGKREMGRRIYGVDPSRLTIWMPDGELLPVEYMLRQTDFENIAPYKELEKSGREGVVVVLARNSEEEREYSQFVLSHKSDLYSTKVAFVLYTGQYRVTPDTFNAYPMVMTANMPATVTSAILTLARALHPVPGKNA